MIFRFLYNDAMYLAEKLSEFSTEWKEREDLSKRAKLMLRTDNDVKSMQAFAHRAYRDEMNTQKTVIRDLLGGTCREEISFNESIANKQYRGRQSCTTR